MATTAAMDLEVFGKGKPGAGSPSKERGDCKFICFTFFISPIIEMVGWDFIWLCLYGGERLQHYICISLYACVCVWVCVCIVI